MVTECLEEGSAVASAEVAGDGDIRSIVGLLDMLIERVRAVNPVSAYCLLVGRDELITSYGRHALGRSPVRPVPPEEARDEGVAIDGLLER